MTYGPRTFLSGVLSFLIALLFFIPLSAEDKPDHEAIRKKAIAGDRNAMFELGTAYFQGASGIRRNETLAAYWFRKAAEAGLPDAMYNYALCLNQGVGVKRDLFDGYDWMKKAADAGLKDAKFQLLLTDLRGIPADPEKKREAKPPLPSYAYSQLKILADEHYIPAELFIAEYFLRKGSSAEEVDRGIGILKRLAGLPEPPAEALRMLADCHYEGRGSLPRDTNEMLRLLRLASKRGDAEALGKLAFCYEYGRGVESDLKKAENLYRISALRGNAMSQFKYAEFIANGTLSGNPDVRKAIPWYEKAMKQNNPQAAFRLGVFHLEGIGMEKDERKAAQLFLAAARQNYARAQYNLGCMYAAGLGDLLKDETAAVYWFTLAAKGGDAAALRVLGLRYLEGRGVKRSITTGERLLRQAAEKGDLEAAELLRTRIF